MKIRSNAHPPFIAVFVMTLCFAAAPDASAAGTCEPVWADWFGSGINGPILALTVFDDGSGPALYMGGRFVAAGTITANRIAKRQDGQYFALGQGLNDEVRTLGGFDLGEGAALYAGGEFTQTIDGTALNHVAQWDGQAWSALGGGVDGPVNALALFDDGNGPALFVGGEFTMADGSPASGIARWNGTAWSALGEGVGGVVYALAVYDDGNGPALYAGGDFTSAGTTTARHLARWDGASWSMIDGELDGAVRALAVFNEGGNDSLIVGGEFSSAGSMALAKVGRWDGAAWSAMGAGFHNDVTALYAGDDGTGVALFAGFDCLSYYYERIHRWNGNSWQDINDYDFDPEYSVVYAMASFDNGSGVHLHVAGDFWSPVGPSIATWSQGIWYWEYFESYADPVQRWTYPLDSEVFSLAAFDDGTGPALFAGGTKYMSWTMADQTSYNKWGGFGWQRNLEYEDHTIHALGVFDLGNGPELFAGGEPAQSSDPPKWGVARWDGSTWAVVGSGGKVYALEAFDSGNGPELYAGGLFFSINGVPVDRIAKWDGTNWSDVGGGVNGAIYAMQVFDDGSGPALYVGGWLTMAGGQPASHIVKWDGSTWTDVGGGMNEQVTALQIHDDGNGPALYAGGRFTMAGGAPANYIARWDGNSWTALGSGTNDWVRAMTAFDDGSGEALYVGGSFTEAGGAEARKIARWDGNSWSALGSGITPHYLESEITYSSSDYVGALAAFEDIHGPALYVGGSFYSAGAYPSYHIARWGCVVEGGVQCACGDMNYSGGAVDLLDFNSFVSCYGFSDPNWICPPEVFSCADLNADGTVNLTDFMTFATIFGTTSTATPPDCLN